PTLDGGRTCVAFLIARGAETTAPDGIKFEFAGGTATMTAFNVGLDGNEQGATKGVTISAALATALTMTAMSGTTDHWITYRISMLVNAGGTYIPRVAQNAHATGTATAARAPHFYLDN